MLTDAAATGNTTPPGNPALPPLDTLDIQMPAPRQPAAKPRGELALIDQIRRAASNLPRSSAVRLGIGDDCAILTPPPGHDLVVTTDFSLEGRHFLRAKHSPDSIGHRTLARGLSDLAAMGATPLAAFLSLALPRSIATHPRWLQDFLTGLTALARATKTPLAGGDTSESPTDHIFADILLLGAVPTGQALRRDGARPGDALYCTGHLGGAAAELHRALASKRKLPATNNTAHPHFFPQPRLATGRSLRGKATACIDLSDGLSTDLTHLCKASNVSAELNLAALPIHPLAKKLSATKALRLALHGGEDYELLFTAPPNLRLPKSLAKTPITRIGTITKPLRNTPRITQIAAGGQRSPLQPAGWEHLA